MLLLLLFLTYICNAQTYDKNNISCSNIIFLLLILSFVQKNKKLKFSHEYVHDDDEEFFNDKEYTYTPKLNKHNNCKHSNYKSEETAANYIGTNTGINNKSIFNYSPTADSYSSKDKSIKKDMPSHSKPTFYNNTEHNIKEKNDEAKKTTIIQNDNINDYTNYGIHLNNISDIINEEFKGCSICTLIPYMGLIAGEVVFDLDSVTALKLTNNIITFINNNSISGFF